MATKTPPTPVACCPPLLDAPLGEEDADELATQFAALADPVRLRLLSLIAAAGEACSCNLLEPLGKSQPTISHHLKLLTEAGLVEREQRGKWAWFRLRDDRLAALRDALGERPVAAHA